MARVLISSPDVADEKKTRRRPAGRSSWSPFIDASFLVEQDGIDHDFKHEGGARNQNESTARRRTRHLFLFSFFFFGRGGGFIDAGHSADDSAAFHWPFRDVTRTRPNGFRSVGDRIVRIARPRFDAVFAVAPMIPICGDR